VDYLLTFRRIAIGVLFGLVLGHFSVFAVEVKLNWRVLDWEYSPIDGAVGVLKNAEMQSVSVHGGWLIFSGELAAGALSLAGFNRNFHLRGREYYLPNGRGLLLGPGETGNTEAMQFLLLDHAATTTKNLCGFSNPQKIVSASSVTKYHNESTARLMLGHQGKAVVDTLYVSKEGYHTDRSLVIAYNVADISYLVPLPDADSIPSGLVHIPEGEFVMGSMHGDPDETPIRRVHLSSFYMDTVEVTQGEYESILGVTPWNTVDSTAREDKGENYPAWGVNWFDAVFFCNAKSKAHGRDTVYTWSALEGTAGDGCILTGVEIHLNRRGFRLPTEAEWEYACRAGSTAKFMWGSTLEPVDKYAWYQDNSGWHAHEVGEKKPNWFGLYDIIGNVYEWTNDAGDRNYDPAQTKNPMDTRSSPSKVIRGAGYSSPPQLLRTSDRGPVAPDWNKDFIGFRTVLSDW